MVPGTLKLGVTGRAGSFGIFIVVWVGRKIRSWVCLLVKPTGSTGRIHFSLASSSNCLYFVVVSVLDILLDWYRAQKSGIAKKYKQFPCQEQDIF